MATGTSPAALSPEHRTAVPAPAARFLDRHLGPDAAAQARMLSGLGYAELDQLIAAAVPAAIRSAALRSIPSARAEHEALSDLARMAAGNQVFRSLIGMGYHDCLVPAVIQRNILENPGWYTQYTPYQAEISQGRLESLLNFQTMVCDLTGMGIANASMLDEGSAAAEAMAMALGLAPERSAAPRFFVADDCHAQTIAVVQTRARPLGVAVVVGSARAAHAAEGCFGVLLQYPASDGAVHDYRALAARARAGGALVIAACDLLALTMLTPPGEWGADIALGNSQRFGVPLGFGGPHAAFLATRDELKRHLPGRLVGVSRDSSGAPALRLALQTREQHIRREKATSNICTAQALLANMAAMYAVYHGPAGLRAIAARIHDLARLLHAGLARLGCTPAGDAFFDTVKVGCPGGSQAVLEQAQAARINLRLIDARTVSVALDERSTAAEVLALLAIFNGGQAPAFTLDDLGAGVGAPAWAPGLVRTSPYLAGAVFNRYHSETEMLRYLRRLEAKDLSLAQAMIPLGSCTMKLNATSEMLPVSWPAFAQLHPFAPPAQTAGYRQLFAQLEAWLGEITGFPALSLQPNAGSQGEYAGLLVIRAYHDSRGDGHRRVCLIPASAHGTNPASAVMAGLEVVAVACDAQGNINLADLAAKAAAHAAALACLMVTYPSTHGVFEEGIIEVCRIIHAHGGQVYMDGANMNAQVGLTSPGAIGADVCHLNLHKTFCIPHGGGGPGMGPIGVAAHLAPFLPGHVVVAPAGSGAAAIGAVSAAPWGSAGILPISWMYIAMMGGDGLTTATKVAILSANHIARRLAPHYPVLYAGPHGLVAHECIIDLRPLKAATGIEAEDVAKRLMDYGFHAPTLSFPVAGTLMIEPTESESLDEIERFCRAMISIRGEIQAVAEGRMDRADNPLKHAPHTALAACGDAWPHVYSRELAAFPSAEMRAHKFWPAVGRIDNVYGDRNLVCSCVGMEAYQAAGGAAS